MRRLHKIALALCAGALALPAQAHAQADISEFLAGRWGDAGADWKDPPEDWIYAPCSKGHPRADSAYVFSGDLAHLEVRSNGHQGSATREEPVTSSVTLGEPLDPAELKDLKGYENASFATLIAFERRGLFVSKEFFAGMLLIMAEDRIALISANATGTDFVELNLVRCGDR